jgi:hypothetical protein
MSLTQFANKFDEGTTKQKFVSVGILFLVVALVLAGVFYWGSVSGRGWADSKYLREREENLKKVDEAIKRADEADARANERIENEKQLSAENQLLKKQNEAVAEILKANDAKLVGDARKFDDLVKQRQDKFDEIDADKDFDAQVCGLCADAEKSGFKLSAAFCAPCQKGK